jgi:hypothetical protein
MKQNINFNIRPPTTLAFFGFFTEMFLLNVVHGLEICQHAKFHGSIFTGASFYPPQKFERPLFWYS